MNINIIKELLSLVPSLVPKGENVMEFSKKAYNVLKMKELEDIATILERVDEQEIEYGELFIVKGIVSSMAPINEPKTYIDRICEFNKSEDTTVVAIRPYTLPISKSIEREGKVIAFMYGLEAEAVFEFDCDYTPPGRLIINNNNKFIPILLDNDLLNKIVNKKVEMKVKVKPISSKKAIEMYSYNNENFNELVEYFYDPYNVNISSFILEVEEVINLIEKKVDLGKYSFGIEYKIKKDDYSNIRNELIEACKKVTLKNISIKALCISDEVAIIPCERNVFININGNYKGFYIQIEANNRSIYRYKIRELQEVVKKVRNELKNLGEIEVSFISEEEKLVIFE